MSLTTLEAISYLVENKENVCEAILSPNGELFTKSLFLVNSLNINGYRHLMCVDEPSESCIPYRMRLRDSIPLDCMWKVSNKDRVYLQQLADRIGLDRS